MPIRLVTASSVSRVLNKGLGARKVKVTEESNGYVRVTASRDVLFNAAKLLNTNWYESAFKDGDIIVRGKWV